jgi:hypothetical protein
MNDPPDFGFAWAAGRRTVPSRRGEREGDRCHHDRETCGAQPHGRVDPHEHQGQAQHDPDATDHEPSSGRCSRTRALHLGGELGVLGVQRLLHLLEQLLFVL